NRFALVQDATNAHFERQRLNRVATFLGHINLPLPFVGDDHPRVSLNRGGHLIVRKAATFGQSGNDRLAALFAFLFFKRAAQCGDGVRIAILGQRFGGGGAVVRVFVVIQNPDQSRREFGYFQVAQTTNELGAIFLRSPVRLGHPGRKTSRDIFLLLFI